MRAQRVIVEYPNKSEDRHHSKSEKFKNYALGLAGVISSILIPLIGFTVSSQQKEKEVRLTQLANENAIKKSYIEIGVNILSRTPDSNSENIRKWAVSLINKYSDIKLDDSTRDELIYKSKIADNALSPGSPESIHVIPGTFSYHFKEQISRTAIPKTSDFNKIITLDDLIAQDAIQEKFSNNVAVEIEGYITKVNRGSFDSAYTNDPKRRIIHVYISTSPNRTEGRYLLLARITPNMVREAALNKIDLSIDRIIGLVGKKVKIQGWLFYDLPHEKNAYANNPDGKYVLRATCWEITPITNITVVN